MGERKEGGRTIELSISRSRCLASSCSLGDARPQAAHKTIQIKEQGKKPKGLQASLIRLIILRLPISSSHPLSISVSLDASTWSLLFSSLLPHSRSNNPEQYILRSYYISQKQTSTQTEPSQSSPFLSLTSHPKSTSQPPNSSPSAPSSKPSTPPLPRSHSHHSTTSTPSSPSPRSPLELVQEVLLLPLALPLSSSRLRLSLTSSSRWWEGWEKESKSPTEGP